MGETERTRQALDLACLARRLPAQAVINRDGEKPRPSGQGMAPARGKPHQRERIGAAGNSQDDRGEAFETGEQIFRMLCRERRVVVRHGAPGVCRSPSMKTSNRTTRMLNADGYPARQKIGWSGKCAYEINRAGGGRKVKFLAPPV